MKKYPTLAGFGLERFRTFRELTHFDLAPLTIITGPNSSGKSSIFKALSLLQTNHQRSDLAELDFHGGRHALGSYETTLTRESEGPMTFAFDLPLPGRAIQITSLTGSHIKLMEEVEEPVEIFPGQFSDPMEGATVIGPIQPLRIELTYRKTSDAVRLDGYRLFAGPDRDLLCTVDIWVYQMPLGESPFMPQREVGPPEMIDQYRYRMEFHAEWLFERLGGSTEAVEDVLGVYAAAPEHADELYALLDKPVRVEKNGGDHPSLTNLSNMLGDAMVVYLNDEDGVAEWPPPDEYVPGTFPNPAGWHFHSVPSKEEERHNKALYSHIQQLSRGVFLPILQAFKKSLEQALAPSSLEHTGTLRAYPQRIFIESAEGGAFQNLLEAYSTSEDWSYRQTATRDWMRMFGLGDDVEVQRIADAGYTVSIKRGGQTFELADCGYGYTQLLPLILRAAAGRAGRSTLLIEEPEASLHPNLQSKVADLFLDLTSKGNQLLVETHSEYLIRRLQYLVATGEANPDRIVIYYLGPDPEAEDYIRQIRITESGQLSQEFGPGFLDEAPNLMVDLYKYGSQN